MMIDNSPFFGYIDLIHNYKLVINILTELLKFYFRNSPLAFCYAKLL